MFRLATREHTFTVRLPRIKSKDEVLRELATAHVEEFFTHWHGAKESWYRERIPVWVEIRLNERKAVLAKLNVYSQWWQWRRRRRVLALILHTYGVPKWW